MAKNSNVKSMIPAAVVFNLAKLGVDLRTARIRRKQSLSLWAERLQVSIPTLRKMESGDPSVSMAVYATALWLIEKINNMGDIAAPATDDAALSGELLLIKPSAVRTKNER